MNNSSINEILSMVEKKGYIIFDLDWVIIDIEEINYFSYKSSFNEFLKITLTFEEYIKFFQWTRPQESISKYLKDKNIALWEYELKKIGLKIKNYKYNLLSKIDWEKIIIPYVVDFIRFLDIKWKRIWLATSTISKFTNLILKKIWIANFFHVIVCSENIKKWKPDPEIFNLTFNRLWWLNKNDCLVLEDSLNWINAALSWNFDCICLLRNQSQDFIKEFVWNNKFYILKDNFKEII